LSQIGAEETPEILSFMQYQLLSPLFRLVQAIQYAHQDIGLASKVVVDRAIGYANRV
jgi:hypothetical protein